VTERKKEKEEETFQVDRERGKNITTKNNTGEASGGKEKRGNRLMSLRSTL